MTISATRLTADAAIAARSLAHACPQSSLRRALLQRLVESIDIADAIAPAAWSVTLFPDGFRLNVGQVEALVFRAGVLRVNLVGMLRSAERR